MPFRSFSEESAGAGCSGRRPLRTNAGLPSIGIIPTRRESGSLPWTAELHDKWPRGHSCGRSGGRRMAVSFSPPTVIAHRTEWFGSRWRVGRRNLCSSCHSTPTQVIQVPSTRLESASSSRASTASRMSGWRRTSTPARNRLAAGLHANSTRQHGNGGHRWKWWTEQWALPVFPPHPLVPG